MFVFEDTDKDKNDWEWKLINKTNDSSPVWSDFHVGIDVKCAGGLCVCPTFTFIMSILYVPSYVALRGLTEKVWSSCALIVFWHSGCPTCVKEVATYSMTVMGGLFSFV